ncbi:MAG TPA: hypothetical protein VJP79_04290 [Nitrososphaera sp.]|nr:hypothetical protein [Nitrososphaera sp.]
MTTESSSSSSSSNLEDTFEADNHDQETRKSYYHAFDDKSVENMKRYFKVEDDDHNHDAFLRYLKNRKVPTTTPNDV